MNDNIGFAFYERRKDMARKRARRRVGMPRSILEDVLRGVRPDKARRIVAVVTSPVAAARRDDVARYADPLDCCPEAFSVAAEVDEALSL